MLMQYVDETASLETHISDIEPLFSSTDKSRLWPLATDDRTHPRTLRLSFRPEGRKYGHPLSPTNRQSISNIESLKARVVPTLKNLSP